MRTPSLPEWEAVKDPRDRRCVIYWRLRFHGKSVGSVGRQYGGWHAIGYSQTASSPSGNTELGTFPTRRTAEHAVLTHWKSWTT